MKTNKITKLFLSLLMVLTIICTNADLVSVSTFTDCESQIQLLGEEPENSPFKDWEQQ